MSQPNKLHPGFPVSRRAGWIAGVALLALGAPSGPARASGLLLADGGFGGSLEVAQHEVRVTLNNGIAMTEVTQVFRNLEDRQVEALYTFPVPRGASVSGFSMWIGGKEMVGEVVEKKRAREIYESYKARRVDPGLLEQADFKTFEMRIFPIGPRAEQRVQITYYQEVDYDDDWITYVYPLATTTRKDVRSSTAGKLSFRAHVKSEVPIVQSESPSHAADFVFARHGETYVESSLETDGADLNRDVVLAYKLARPRTGLDLVASKPKGEDGHFLLLLTAGEDLAALDRGMDYVFVLDVSGSMEADGKLRMSRGSVAAFVDELGALDRFELIAFNLQPQGLFGKLAALDETSKTASRAFLESREPKGGTVLRPAIEMAYRYADADRPLNVVLLSDGLTEQRDREALRQLIAQRPGNSRVFCIGVGNDVNRPLLEELAEEAGGLAAFLSRGDDFQRQAKAFRRKLTRPVATGLSVEIAGVETFDIEPQRLPNLYHGLPLRVYGRYRKGGKASVTLRADLGARELKNVVELELPDQESSNPEVERMWAWKRLDRLVKEADRGSAPQKLTDEIVRLGETYSIASPYTSFLVLENDVEYQRWRIDRRNVARDGRDRQARDKLLARLDKLRDETAAGLGPQEPATAASPVTIASRQGAPASGASAPRAQPERSRPADSPGGSGPVGPLFVALSAWLLRRKRRRDENAGAA